jgi:catechol 2,3-dioxygenase-like lactoylglutathione lyase family enzyme
VSPPFQSLDFIYMPSADVAAGVEYFTRVLGARLLFAIEAFDTRVAMVELTEAPPRILLAGHLEGERAVLVYRVPSLDRGLEELEARGWEPQPRFGIPHGPVCAFQTPDGHRLAVYELTRPEANERLTGRRDFEV